MDEPGSRESSETSLRELAERLLLAGADALTTTREHAGTVTDASADLQRLRQRATRALAGLVADLGFVTADRFAELEVKVAQLEHRLRLLEERQDS